MFEKLPITTPRLVIRAPLKKDVTDILQGTQESRPELEQWMAWAKPWPDKDAIKAFILKTVADFPTDARHRRFECFERESGRFLVSLGCATDKPAGHFHLDCWTRNSDVSHGYATEAVAGLCRYLFTVMGATRIESGYELGNIGGKRVLEKCGFDTKETVKKAVNGKIRLQRLCALADPAALPALEIAFG